MFWNKDVYLLHMLFEENVLRDDEINILSYDFNYWK